MADRIKGRQWSLPLADRVLLVATHYRTNLTMRQLSPLSGIKTTAVHRIIDRLGPFLALAPAGKVRPGHRPDRGRHPRADADYSVAASSENYRYSVNMQVMINAKTRLVALRHEAW